MLTELLAFVAGGLLRTGMERAAGAVTNRGSCGGAEYLTERVAWAARATEGAECMADPAGPCRGGA